MTEVVAALIWDKNTFLACQRPPHKTRGLMWEFVGGKVEPGETKAQALIRECKEELDVLVSVVDVFMEQIHEYPDLTIRLTLFNARIAEGTPKKLEHNDIRWLRVGEISDYTFCPADAVFLEKLQHKDIQKQLFARQDEGYKAFQCKLMPEVPVDTVIGVRMPALREYGEQIQGMPEAAAFLHDLPHQYYDENNLHGYLISEMRNLDATFTALEEFLPYVDNWATCDMLSPKSFAKHPDSVLEQTKIWMASGHTYTVRFGICTLMRHFLDDKFRPEYLAWVASVHSDAYYIKMMVAWFFATALAKQYDSAITYIENHTLEVWIHNKEIQKSIESRRISDDQKAYLRSLSRKK